MMRGCQIGDDVRTSYYLEGRDTWPRLTRGTVTAIEHGWRVTVQPAEGQAFVCPVGRLSPWFTPEQAESARIGARAAGFVFGLTEWGCEWRKRSDGGSHAYTVHPPQPDDPEPVTWDMVNAFGHEHDCQHCGLRINLGFVGREQLIAERSCLECQGWLSLANRDRGRSIITEDDRGRHHSILGEGTGPASTRGYGGARFDFRRLDTGERVTTKDLWSQGRIPERFYDLFPVTHTRWTDA